MQLTIIIIAMLATTASDTPSLNVSEKRTCVDIEINPDSLETGIGNYKVACQKWHCLMWWLAMRWGHWVERQCLYPQLLEDRSM
ncbi:uncharacterized protein N7484_007838 [Penicillium longicatenatum]|uniref:uncharacterized protein n=1 Tax=Penicillium longicatenatum TaxID=1561947 RepID=UPI0025474DB5|nr:uncharacterized protein N7484_007838 [Penicillium longicatenatum]KAJ5639976.1 hypothetical protein N7484_007838 [Penicillium longicatenatum]